MDLSLISCIEKIVHGVSTHKLSGNEKASDAVVNKVDNADCLLRHKKPNAVGFLKT